MKKKYLIIRNQLIFVTMVILLAFIVATGYESKSITINDVSSARSIQAIHLVSKYNKNVVKTKTVTTFSDVLKYASSMPVKFSGVITGYGPDCRGCGGKTGCPPSQNVRNGNIYFNDQTYGKINIVATDSRIPCGSVVKITNSSLGKEIIAIALDRGGAIKGTKMDFLVKSESEALTKVGRQNVTYEIIRWGW